jgi:hypothetical protein
MTPNPLYFLYTYDMYNLWHKYLLPREGGQTPCQNKQEIKLGTLTMSTEGEQKECLSTVYIQYIHDVIVQNLRVKN